MNEDSIELNILDDGTIVATTDPISSGNHVSADKFLRLLEELTGAKAVRSARKNTKVHTHTHTHEHEGH